VGVGSLLKRATHPRGAGILPADIRALGPSRTCFDCLLAIADVNNGRRL